MTWFYVLHNKGNHCSPQEGVEGDTPLPGDFSRLVPLPYWKVLTLTPGGNFSFKCSLDYFKAEKVKYWPNMPELLTDNIC